MVNPLHHIPIVSTLYQSITGDTIDPGAKIVGGTLFGGPLGAAFSSLDVALEHSTGRDIADHSIAFFIGMTEDQNKPAPAGVVSKRIASLSAQVGKQSNRGQAMVSLPQPIEAGLKPLTADSTRHCNKDAGKRGKISNCGHVCNPHCQTPIWGRKSRQSQHAEAPAKPCGA